MSSPYSVLLSSRITEQDEAVFVVARTHECDAAFIAAGLSAYEQGVYTARPQHKKTEWLCGRLAVKRALAAHIERTYGVTLPFSTLEITSRVHNPPRLTITSDAPVLPHGVHATIFSLAHCGELAVACAEEQGIHTAIGVDTERIRTFNEATLRAFLTSREYERYVSLPHEERPVYATLVWCIKEAYLKALGVGLRVHPARLAVVLRMDEAEITADGALMGAQVRWTIFEGVYILVYVGIRASAGKIL